MSLTILSIAEFSSESFNFIVQTFFIFNISLVIFDILTTQENSDFISLYNSIFHKNKDYLSCIPLLFSSGVRPCELNLSNLEFKDKKWNIYLNYYKYYQSLDRNEQEKALRIIRQLKKDMTVYTSEVDEFFKANINYEFLFCCFLTNDIKTAKNVYQEIQENHKEVHPLCKPRSLASYELLINENVKESQKTYEECYQDFHVPFFKGMEIFEKSMAEKYNFVS
ncbi:hypothetical protein [Amphibacillus indicireducens]|uniref:Uncharacterized protein n=1 Tax=Amphibacillus indicireducens TaxID=1076330 RepID=A0ABP7V268_9BACI